MSSLEFYENALPIAPVETERSCTMSTERPRLAVVGLGFIGLPLALCYALKGASVVGLDVEERVIGQINGGNTPLQESYAGEGIQDILRREIEAGRFFATSEYSRAAELVDSYMLTVGIPIDDGHPDTSHLEAACRSLGEVLKPGDLVLVRSTVIPGTTEGLIRRTLEDTSGLKCPGDFHLAYSSERIAEGRAFEEFIHMPLAVGGIDETSLQRAVQLLDFISESEIHTSDIQTVETAKVLENVQRDINIAISQEMATFTDALGIDTHRLIDIANTHRRVNLLRPGPGVGGYCLPNALHYLLPRARELGIDLPLARRARRTNEEVPERLCGVMGDMLSRRGRKLRGSRIALLGLAMKDYSSDDRHSPARRLAEQLSDRGAELRAYDPIVPDGHPYAVDDLDYCVTGSHGLILAARQECFDALNWSDVASRMADYPVIMDTRNCINEGDLPPDAALWRI